MSTHKREPIAHTCPDIDKVLKSVSKIEKLSNTNGREDEDQLKDIISDIEFEISNINDLMEKLRRSNDELRAWGIEEAEKVDELELQIEELSTKQVF